MNSCLLYSKQNIISPSVWPHPTTVPSLMLRTGINPVGKAAHVGLRVVLPSLMACAPLLPTHPIPQV